MLPLGVVFERICTTATVVGAFVSIPATSSGSCCAPSAAGVGVADQRFGLGSRVRSVNRDERVNRGLETGVGRRLTRYEQQENTVTERGDVCEYEQIALWCLRLTTGTPIGSIPHGGENVGKFFLIEVNN